MVDHDKFHFWVKQLYAIVKELENMFPGRHFSPDGHMVGSLGECLVADAYGLELQTASNKGFDVVAYCPDFGMKNGRLRSGNELIWQVYF